MMLVVYVLIVSIYVSTRNITDSSTMYLIQEEDHVMSWMIYECLSKDYISMTYIKFTEQCNFSMCGV